MSSFEKNVLGIFGQRATIWLSDLPKLIDEIAKKYNLSSLNPVKNLSYNYVLSGFQHDQPIILKLGLDVDALKREAKALKHFKEHGAVNIIAESEGMLLLERAIPGSNLKLYFPTREVESIQIFCDVMKRLHISPHPEIEFPHVRDWLRALDMAWDIPGKYLQKARELRDQLLATSTESCLLHGDLHHENILQNGQGWVMIDPKGVIGEPIFEVAAFIRNPIPELLRLNNAEEIIQNRIKLIGKILNIEVVRIVRWCFVESVLGWIWQIQDNLDPSYFIHLTNLFFDAVAAPPSEELSLSD